MDFTHLAHDFFRKRAQFVHCVLGKHVANQQNGITQKVSTLPTSCIGEDLSQHPLLVVHLDSRTCAPSAPIHNMSTFELFVDWLVKPSSRHCQRSPPRLSETPTCFAVLVQAWTLPSNACFVRLPCSPFC